MTGSSAAARRSHAQPLGRQVHAEQPDAVGGFDGAYHPRERCTAVDVLLTLPVARLTPLEARRHYGAEVYAVACRRLARKELRQYPIPVRWWG